MKLASDPPTVALLTRQLGVASRVQLLALGWREDQVDGAVQQRRLEVVQRGVYRIPGGGRPEGQAAMAAVLRIGAGARISGAGVLAIHRIDGVAPDSVGVVLVAPPRRPRVVPVRWRRDWSPDHDHDASAPIPSTSVDRALVELAADWTSRRWLGVFDHCRWRRLATTSGVIGTVERLGRRHPGVRHLERLIEANELVRESHGERDLAAGLRAIGVPDAAIRWQQQISPRHRVDALMPEYRLVIEYDGRDFHTDPRDRARDRQRDDEVMALGYQVVRVDAADLRDLRRLRKRLDQAILAAASTLATSRS